MASERTSLMMGLTASGKTTFLAALWHVLRAGDVPGALVLDRLAGDEHYVNGIYSSWLSGDQAARTARSAVRCVELHVKDKQDRRISVIMPDPSGELLKDAVCERYWPAELDVYAQNAAGVLLFVHPHGVVMPHLISAVDIDEAEDEPDDEDGVWEPAMMPTQVMLVEMLQLLRSRSRTLHRIALIVSAWDEARRSFPGIEPVQWLDENVPLLTQYLRARTEYAEWTCFGISAQGGRIPDDKSRLLAHANPSDRLLVVGHPHANEHDVSAPIRWLMADL